MPLSILLHSHHRTRKVRLPWRTEGIARCLADAGHRVTILCTADTARRQTREWTEGPIRWVEAPDMLWGRQRSGWDPWSAWHRLRWLRANRFDVIHCFDTRPAVIHPTLAYLRRRPTPLVLDWADWWGHGGLITENRPRWWRWGFERLETHYEERFRRFADASTVIARGLSRRAEALGVPAESLFWVPCGSTPERIAVVSPKAGRTEVGLPTDAFLLGFNAADVTIGFSLALAAFAEAQKRRPDTRLVITGNLPPPAIAAVKSHPSAAAIHYLGFLHDDVFVRTLVCMDAFLLPFVESPANHGRWPGRINEYFSAGRPVITQPVGEMQRLLESEPIGILAEENPSAVADAIVTLHDNDALRTRMGQRARELAETSFSWRALRPTLEQSYSVAITRHAQRLK